MNCSNITPDLCREFPQIEKDCLATCKFCKCEDEKDCSTITSNLCERYPGVKNACHKTCHVCKAGLYVMTKSINIRVSNNISKFDSTNLLPCIYFKIE